MATNYSFKGAKGHRKAVKTIDIHEESYLSLRKMVDDGMNSADVLSDVFIEDVYNMFGGDCYDTLVSMAIECLLSNVVHNLESKCFLAKSGSEVFGKLSDTILPVMCCVNDEDGASVDELRFFNTDVEDLISGISPCLTENIGKAFAENLREAVLSDKRPAGEVAFGILMYISSEVVSADPHAN